MRQQLSERAVCLTCTNLKSKIIDDSCKIYILLWIQTRSRVWSFPNDRIHYIPQYTVARVRLRETYGNSDNHFIALRPEMTGQRNRSLSLNIAFASSSQRRAAEQVHHHRFQSRNRVLKSVLHRSGLVGVTDVHCITNGRTFHLQKKKVHNKSSDLSANHPVAPTSRVWEPAENEISLRRGVSRVFKIQKVPSSRRSTLGELWLDGEYGRAEMKSRTRKISSCLTERTRRQPVAPSRRNRCWLYGRLRYCHTQRKTLLSASCANIPMLMCCSRYFLVLILTVPGTMYNIFPMVENFEVASIPSDSYCSIIYLIKYKKICSNCVCF